jgi:hypothetical protein
MMSDEKRAELQAISESIVKQMLKDTKPGRVKHVFNFNPNRTKNQPLFTDTCYKCELKNPTTKFCKGRPKKAEA